MNESNDIDHYLNSTFKTDIMQDTKYDSRRNAGIFEQIDDSLAGTEEMTYKTEQVIHFGSSMCGLCNSQVQSQLFHMRCGHVTHLVCIGNSKLGMCNECSVPFDESEKLYIATKYKAKLLENYNDYNSKLEEMKENLKAIADQINEATQTITTIISDSSKFYSNNN